MKDQRRSRKQMAIFVGVSIVAHVAILLCVPVGANNESVGKKLVREIKEKSIEFVKIVKPKPKPKPVVVPKQKPKPKPRPRRRRIVRRTPTPPKPEEKTLEARVLPPPEPEPVDEPAPEPTPDAQPEPEPVVQPEPEAPPAPEPEPEPIEIPKATPTIPDEVVVPVTEPEPTPTIDTSDMVAMAPQPITEGPKTDPTNVPGPPEPGRVIVSTEQPTAPSAPDLGNPEVTRPEPASGGDAKRAPQIGLDLGVEDRSSLPGQEHRIGVSEEIAGTGGPRPLKVSPNPGGSTGGAPRVALRPRRDDVTTGPLVRSGVANGRPDAPGAAEGATRGPGAPDSKRMPGNPGPLNGITTGTGPNAEPSPGSGDTPGLAAPGNAVDVMTSPTSDMVASLPGADGFDAGGTGGGGGGDIVFSGGGLGALVAGGPGGDGGPGGGGGSGMGKSAPRLGSPWGGPGGAILYARDGSGGAGPGGYASGDGGEGGGTGGGIGDGDGTGVGGGIGDDAGPGSGMGEPIRVAMAGPGGGYGHGDSPLPVGFPDGTTTDGAPGFAWLEPGLGRSGGSGPGLFGGPHGRGSGGGYPGRGDKSSPGFGGVPGGMGVDIPAPSVAGGGGGGGGDQPGGLGIFGPLTVGGGPGGTGGPGDLVALAKRVAGIPVLPAGLVGTLGGLAGGGDGPGGRGIGGGIVGKQAPTGIYADLVGTYDVPVGVTNSDYNTDEVSVLNLLGVMRERTNVRVEINQRYVPLEYEAIKDQPLLWISGHKAFAWTPEERTALRKYVENGGTILAEDCHGPFNQVFPDEIRRVFGEELEPVPMDDELFRSFYVIDELPAGDVQERLPIQGLRTKGGRLGVIYSRNDYSDAWKVPKGSYVPDETKEQAFRMGINWYVYILAHWRQGQAAAAATP